VNALAWAARSNAPQAASPLQGGGSLGGMGEAGAIPVSRGCFRPAEAQMGDQVWSRFKARTLMVILGWFGGCVADHPRTGSGRCGSL